MRKEETEDLPKGESWKPGRPSANKTHPQYLKIAAMLTQYAKNGKMELVEMAGEHYHTS